MQEPAQKFADALSQFTAGEIDNEDLVKALNEAIRDGVSEQTISDLAGASGVAMTGAKYTLDKGKFEQSLMQDFYDRDSDLVIENDNGKLE